LITDTGETLGSRIGGLVLLPRNIDEGAVDKISKECVYSHHPITFSRNTELDLILALYPKRTQPFDLVYLLHSFAVTGQEKQRGQYQLVSQQSSNASRH
jgi:hypothetical protein